MIKTLECYDMARLRYSDIKDFENVYLLIEDEKENVSEAVGLKICSTKEELVSKIGLIFEEGIKRAKLKNDIQVLQQKQNSTSMTLEDLQKEFQQKKKSKDTSKERKSQIQRLTKQYEKYTGMKITPVNDVWNASNTSAISITFTSIDESNPSTPFGFILITNGETYNVESCTPPINGMDGLISEVNKTLDISSFIINVRKKFKNTVLSSNH